MEEDTGLNPTPTSLKEFIRKEIEKSYEARVPNKPITIAEYLDLLQSDPELAQLSHQRMHSIVKSIGYDEISQETDPRRAEILGLDSGFVMKVPKLFRNLKGIEEVLFEIDNYLYIAAGQGEASRQMLYFYGPPSSGKTTIAEILRRVLENSGFWQLKGCEHHDSPVNATPRHIRKEIYEKFGIYIDPRADICPKCRIKLINDYKMDYTQFQVEWRNFSQRRGCGIAVVSEVDPINFNMAVLIGEEDISLLGEYRRGDPETLVLNGAFNKGQRGLTEFVEIFKNPIEAQRPIITLTQERYVPLPKFAGQIYADTMAVSHSNETEWQKFKSDTANEAIMNRIYVVKVPHNLRLKEEVEIYRDSFLGRSLQFNNIHIDPHSLEQVAMFVLFTRLAPSKTNKYNTLTKIKLRDGQKLMSGGEPVDISAAELLSEADTKEGMVGLSYRDAMKGIIEQSLAYYRNIWEKDGYLNKRGGYLSPVWLRNSMVRYINKLDIPLEGDWPRASKKRWLFFIQDELQKEFVQLIKGDLLKAYASRFGVSLEEKSQILLNLYIDNVISMTLNNVYDKKFVDSVEENLNMKANGKDAFRLEIAKAGFSLRSEGQQIGPEVMGPLVYAITERIRKRYTGEMLESIQDESKKYKLIETLKESGYAELGAKLIIDYASSHFNRD